MSLVDYASDDSDDEPTPSLKRRRSEDITDSKRVKLPALPAFFVGEETPSTDGRIRSKPHLVNSWATHVYIEVTADELQPLVEQLTQTTAIHALPSLHISLSRCASLKEHQLDNFADAIQKAIQGHQSFDIAFADLCVLTNDEDTRSFVGIEVGLGYNELLALVGVVDEVMRKFKQPTFYKPARFHASLVWSLEKRVLDEAVASLPSKEMDMVRKIRRTVTRLCVKMGNRVVATQLI